jgi:hypothetical protein
VTGNDSNRARDRYAAKFLVVPSFTLIAISQAAGDYHFFALAGFLDELG